MPNAASCFDSARSRQMTQPGLRWHIPWPVETVETINTNVTERFPYQGSMLTRDENIVLVDLVVQYRRTDPEDYPVQHARARGDAGRHHR